MLEEFIGGNGGEVVFYGLEKDSKSIAVNNLIEKGLKTFIKSAAAKTGHYSRGIAKDNPIKFKCNIIDKNLRGLLSLVFYRLKTI